MAFQHENQLEKARAFFYEWRLMDAYNILRRHYSRLPFQPEASHGEYIGMFIRILSELGRSRELHFYLGELERLVRNRRNPHVSYQLASVYAALPQRKIAEAEQIFSDLLKDPAAKEYHARVKMMLAWIYDHKSGDTLSCRLLIDSIEPQTSRDLDLLTQIWKCKLLSDEKKYDVAEKHLLGLLGKMNLPHDWYAYTSTKIIYIKLLFKTGRAKEARNEMKVLKKSCEGKHFRSVALQLKDIEKLSRGSQAVKKRAAVVSRKNQPNHRGGTVNV
jgi:hypothetical protein